MSIHWKRNSVRAGVLICSVFLLCLPAPAESDTHRYSVNILGWTEGFPGGTRGKEPTCNAGDIRTHGSDPWVGKIPTRRKRQPTPVFLPGEPHGQRAWQATVHRVVKSQIWLKQLSTHKYTNNRMNGMSYQTRQLTEYSFVDPKLHSRGILGESQSFPWSQDTDIDGNRNMCSMRIPPLCWYCFSPNSNIFSLLWFYA